MSDLAIAITALNCTAVRVMHIVTRVHTLDNQCHIKIALEQCGCNPLVTHDTCYVTYSTVMYMTLRDNVIITAIHVIMLCGSGYYIHNIYMVTMPMCQYTT